MMESHKWVKIVSEWEYIESKNIQIDLPSSYEKNITKDFDKLYIQKIKNSYLKMFYSYYQDDLSDLEADASKFALVMEKQVKKLVSDTISETDYKEYLEFSDSKVWKKYEEINTKIYAGITGEDS